MKNIKTATDLREEIQSLVNASSIDAVADRFKVTPVYIYLILQGKRLVSKTLAEQLGYTKIRQPKPEPIFHANENNSDN